MENKADRYQKAVNITDVLEQSPFAKIMKKGLAINKLNQKFNRIFPQEFHGKFRIGNITDHLIFIEVSNAIVRQGILFRQIELLTLIQEEFPQVTGFEITINPGF
ncbi:TPA: DciA family protein [Haemophilus influenzae]